jgi:predicted HTH domain antitoxin
MPLTLEIPDEIAKAMRVPEGEKQQRAMLELSCALYARGLISIGKAARLAGVSRFIFGHELTAREIPRHYTKEHARADLNHSE